MTDRIPAPAFQYFPSDIEAHTAAMTDAEVAAYLRLMNACWKQPAVPFDFERLALIARTTPAKMRKSWPALAPWFPVVDGRVTYPHIERERVRQTTKSQKNRDAANTRWHAHVDSDDDADADTDAHANADASAMPGGCPATATASAPAVELTTEAVAVGARAIVAALNRGLAEHEEPRRRQLDPIRAVHPASEAATRAILGAGVPVPFAEAEVYALAKSHNAEGKIYSLGYFSEAVVRAWQAECDARAAAESGAPEAAKGRTARRAARNGQKPPPQRYAYTPTESEEDVKWT